MMFAIHVMDKIETELTGVESTVKAMLDTEDFSFMNLDTGLFLRRRSSIRSQ